MSFIGNIHTADRKKYINFLTRNGIDIQVYGLGSKNGEINREQYISIIKNSKINLNFTKVSLSKSLLNKEPWRLDSRQLKGRPFEIFALGSFVFLNGLLTQDFCLTKINICLFFMMKKAYFIKLIIF